MKVSRESTVNWPISRCDKDAASQHESVATRPTIDPCRASVDHVSIDI